MDGSHDIVDVIGQIVKLCKITRTELGIKHFDGKELKFTFDAMILYDLKGKDWKLFVLP